MKTVTVYKRDGSEAGSIDLPDEIFGIEPSMVAIHQAINAHLVNKRQGNACAKTRSEVDVSKQKPFRQKGTGRARSGSANSPVWVGGGVTFGPRPHDYKQRINRKVRRLALKSAYSLKASEDRIKVVEDFDLDEPKTREIAGMLKALGLGGEKTIMLLGGKSDVIVKSSRNIPKTSVALAREAHAYQIMNSDVVLFTKSAVDRVCEVFQEGAATS